MNRIDPFEPPPGVVPSEATEVNPVAGTVAASSTADELGHAVHAAAVWTGPGPAPWLRPQTAEHLVEDVRARAKAFENEAKTLRAQLENVTTERDTLAAKLAGMGDPEPNALAVALQNIQDARRELGILREANARAERELVNVRVARDHAAATAKNWNEAAALLARRLGMSTGSTMTDALREIDRLRARSELLDTALGDALDSLGHEARELLAGDQPALDAVGTRNPVRRELEAVGAVVCKDGVWAWTPIGEALRGRAKP